MRDPLDGRLGLNVPYEWWPALELLAEIEEAGFSWEQLCPFCFVVNNAEAGRPT